MEKYDYFYNKQIRSYLLQFMAVLSGFQVEVGRNDKQESRLIDVPVHYGSKDRVVASILGENTQNKPLRLPLISAHMNNVMLAPDLRKGIGTERGTSYMPQGSWAAQDVKVNYTYMPVPYMMQAEAVIYTSNLNEHLQIMEQMLVLFDPSITIQTSEETFDMGKVTRVELTNISYDENYPAGPDRRTLQTTLTFEMPIYLSVPKQTMNNIIEKIQLRVGVVGQDTDMSDPSSVIDALDTEGLDYELFHNGSDLDIDQ